MLSPLCGCLVGAAFPSPRALRVWYTQIHELKCLLFPRTGTEHLFPQEKQYDCGESVGE